VDFRLAGHGRRLALKIVTATRSRGPSLLELVNVVGEGKEESSRGWSAPPPPVVAVNLFAIGSGGSL